jgi:hypothetical protein
MSSFRLYERAWVLIEGYETAQQVHKDAAYPGQFVVAGHRYDIDARAVPQASSSPAILSLLSLQAAAEAGLHSDYSLGI